ncbi:MAG: response regulator [Crocosphaera sp.]|nr:response regulator [Crocosphaera sp.]
MLEESAKLLSYIPATVSVAKHNFYYSLTLIAHYLDASSEQQKLYWQQVETNQKEMKNWADHCPENFLDKYLLVSAEMARVSGQWQEAMELYDRAIESAQENEFIQNEALGNELAGKFWLARGKEDFAKLYMRKAHQGYQIWGAKRKVQDLEQKYPQWFSWQPDESSLLNLTSITTSRKSTTSLDIETFLKASQAISGEINLDALLQKLMTIVIENAGAQTGCLLLPNFDQSEKLENFLIAIYSNDHETTFSPELPISELLPKTIVYYVERTYESVVIDDASRSENFSQDPYIQSIKQGSILCYRLLNQGQLVGLVYLENKITVGAFTKERIEFLQLLSGQAAIALSNARLYAKVSQSEEQLKQFLEAVPVGIGVVDKNGHPYYANQLAKKILGQWINPETKPLLNDNYINITIKDTGVGIAAEELDKLFEAFTQTESGKKSSEGTGLGLPISRKFVQLMGGDIMVTSELGVGTTFSFNIYITKVNADTIETKPIVRHVIALQPGQPRYKILIVDDHPANRLLLIKLLQPVGFEVQEATNGQEAIKKWEAWQPHLIFMDMRMPIMDGYEATQYIKGIIKVNATAIVALTASVLEEEKAVVLSTGCDDFIRKPFRESVIFEVISKHIGVEYVYEEKEKTKTKLLNLNPDDLIIMPQEWLERLYHASKVLDDDLILELIEEIPKSNCLLADKLTGLINSFQLKKIKEVLKSISSTNLE